MPHSLNMHVLAYFLGGCFPLRFLPRVSHWLWVRFLDFCPELIKYESLPHAKRKFSQKLWRSIEVLTNFIPYFGGKFWTLKESSIRTWSSCSFKDYYKKLNPSCSGEYSFFLSLSLINCIVVKPARLAGFVFSLSITQRCFCCRVPWRGEAAEKSTKKKRHLPRYGFHEHATLSKNHIYNSRFIFMGFDRAIRYINLSAIRP